MTNNIDLAVAAMLRHERHRLGLTQSDFADVAGVVQSQISSIEQGKHKVPLATLVTLVTTFNLGPPGDFVSKAYILSQRDIDLRRNAIFRWMTIAKMTLSDAALVAGCSKDDVRSLRDGYLIENRVQDYYTAERLWQYLRAQVGEVPDMEE